VNKIHFDSTKSADDTRWRSELLGYGLQLARRLLAQASALTSLPVQAIVSLQSAEGEADPDIDFATGAVHISVIRSPADDSAPAIEANSQPTLTLTTGI
jgi:hypothetical protein